MGKKWITTHWNLFSALCLLAGLGWIVLSAHPDPTENSAAPFNGFEAPPFLLPNANGELVSLESFSGQVIVLNFWASWCEPCKQEMPALEKAFQMYEEQGLVVVGVNATRSDQAANALRFAQSQGLTFPILFDVEGLAANDYRIQLLPTTFFIRRDGTIYKLVSGGMSEALILATIEELLPEETR